MKLPNRHVLIVGASGSGKSTAEVKELVEEAERGHSAIICLDPHVESLAGSFFAYLCERGLEHRVLYDRLSDLDRVLKWDFLAPSTAATKPQRLAENDNRCREFADVLMRRRGKSSLAETPGIEEWTLAALGLYIHQRQRRPLADLRYAFLFGHPTFQAMFDGCHHKDVRDKFVSIIDSGQTPYKAAERLIAGVCSSPAFQFRTTHLPGFSLDRHLDARGILIVEGGAGGPLSHDAMQIMMGAVILQVINYVRARRREHPHVTLSLDEANNAALIGESGHEVRALAECRKYGLGVHILVQYLDFPSAQITDGVLTNCATRKYFYCPETRTAARLGADLGGSYSQSSTSTRYYRDGTRLEVPTSTDAPFADDLRNLGIGECYVRRHNSNELLQVTPLPDPFGLSKGTLRVVMDGFRHGIKRRAEYCAPGDQGPPPAAPMASPAGQPPPAPLAAPNGTSLVPADSPSVVPSVAPDDPLGI